MTGRGGKIHAGRTWLSWRPHIFVTLRRGQRVSIQCGRGDVGIDHIAESAPVGAGRPGISWFPDGIDLGLDTGGQAAEAADPTAGPVFNRFRSCYGVSPARDWERGVCSCDSRLPVLRPSPHADIRMRILAFSWRDRSWNRWSLATEFTALARPGFGAVHACILDHGDGRGISPGRLLSPGGK